jgi:sugar lactone lactonase YvrE
VLLPITLVALSAVLGALLGPNRPFQGVEMSQLTATGGFVSALFIAALGGYGLYRMGRDLGWGNLVRLAGLAFFGLLALLTMRAAFIASYINYDSANEFLVYAHGARGVKTVMAQIDDLNARLNDGVGLKVAYDSDVAWPMTWYLREYDQNNYAFYGQQPTREKLDAPVVIAGPTDWSKVESILGDRYYKFEYIRMVWPMQDYFNLITVSTDPETGKRTVNWDHLKQGFTDPQMRAALWQIWWNRDYSQYGTLTNQNFDLSQWPVAERMRFYVRKDVAAQVWNYGVGPTALAAQPLPEDPYVKSQQTLNARLAFGAEGAGPGQFNAPRAVAVAPDGSVYVADSRNHRIQKFDAQGNFQLSFGGFGSLDAGTAAPGKFNEPWGLGIGPDGSVYVADTWNHRIQKFDANGQFIKTWGTYGQGPALDQFWGPRAIAVDAQGRVFVADTGNKRISIFDRDGNPLSSVGVAGSGPGEFDEPVGIALGPDGALYVADTWNQRMQKFTPSSTGAYSFVKEWPIVGWYGQSLDNKPYVAVDARGRVYVTDPEGYRVLVFDGGGTFLTTWGSYGSDTTTFGLAAAAGLDAAGDIYVSDAANNRVLKFDPLK